MMPLLITLLVMSCSNDTDIVSLFNDEPELTVTGISPQSGYCPTEVTIEGKNFGASKELVKVYFTGCETSAEIVSCEDDKLVANVPENAQSGPITVIVNKMKFVAEDFPFTVIPAPELSSVSPDRTYGGKDIIVFGHNFGNDRESIKLYSIVEDKEMCYTILECANDKISATVPEITTFGEIGLYLEISGRPAVNHLNLTLLEKATIISVKPLSGSKFVGAGDKIEVDGKAFGTDKSSVTVKMADLHATVLACADNKIIAEVPIGFKGGKVTVVKDGLSSISSEDLTVLSEGMVITPYLLNNYEAPFTPAEFEEDQGSDVWDIAVPAGWIVNDAAKNLLNRYKNKTWCTRYAGGLFMNSTGEGLSIGMQAGWNNNTDERTLSISNGKIYQCVSLPKGRYSLEVTYCEVVLKGSPYIAICKDVDEIRNPDELSTSNGDIFWKFENLDKNSPSKTHILEFNLDKESKVCIGFTANMGRGSCFKVKQIKLTYVGQ